MSTETYRVYSDTIYKTLSAAHERRIQGDAAAGSYERTFSCSSDMLGIMASK
jgi:hypothetical protein